MTVTQAWPPEWPPTHSPWQPPPPAPVRQPVPLVAAPEDRVGEALLARRVVLLTGPLGWEQANDAAARLMLLDGDSEADVHLYLGCPGGDLDAALMLADTVDLMRGTVRAVAQGTLGGAALAPYAAASCRLALPHTLFELREPQLAAAHGTARSLTDQAAVHRRQSAQLRAWLAKATGQQDARIVDDLRAGLLLDAPQAVDYGLVQHIVGVDPAPTA